MTAQKIITDLAKKHFKPVYWLEGEEEFFIDEVIHYAEQSILSESEASFNLTVFYGRDADWATILNACRRYPMFAERQVVIIKEAQDMKGIEKLESYVEKPLSSTLLFVAYKGKKLDGRTRLSKLLKDRAVHFISKKLYDSELPEWTTALLKTRDLTISSKALYLVVDHIGNDLNRLKNEIDKLALNLGSRKNITEDDVEKYIGISKEFNVFELQHALAQKDLYKTMRIVQYFESNPKAGPLQLIFPSLYNFFSKVYIVLSSPTADEKGLAASIGVSPYFVKEYLHAARRYGTAGVEKILLLLHVYNLKSIGINDAGTNDMSLLKEMAVKIIHD
jgi:DNA polymerase III subunit delta